LIQEKILPIHAADQFRTLLDSCGYFIVETNGIDSENSRHSRNPIGK